MIALGLVATLAVDVAQAAGAGPSTASREKAYLTKLRPIALDVHNAVAPVEQMVRELITPHPGDVYAARDALLHGDALSQLQSAAVELRKLPAPKQLMSRQHDLVSAVTVMESALRKVHGFSSQSGWHLADAVNQFGDGDIQRGEYLWQDALSHAYATVKATAPAGLGGVKDTGPASRTAWIFGADRTCSAASFRIAGPTIRLLHSAKTTSDLESYWGSWQQTFTWVKQRLTSMPKPTGTSALPRQLVLRVRTLTSNATIAARLRSAFAHRNPVAIAKSLSQIDQVSATLGLLGSDLNTYGARSCGLVLGQWSGHGISGSASHHTPKTVST